MNTTLKHAVRKESLAGPMQSTVVKEIISYANDPATSVAKLSSLLVKDPGLVQRILRKASSPLYGYNSRKSMTVDFAIILLGFDVLKETVSSMVVNNALRNMVNVLFHYEEFWGHSLSCAFVARQLAEEKQLCNPDDAFIAGLLHDIGYLILLQYANDVFQKQPKDPAIRNGQTIEKLCGWTHSEVGQWIAERWNLPEHITEAIFYHHTPQLATIDPKLTATVHFADVMCNERNLGRFSFEAQPEYHLPTLAAFGIDESSIDMEKIQEYSTRMKDDLGGAQSFEELISDLKSSFINAISDMPENDKIVLALYYYEGLTFEEIAQILKLDERSVSERHAAAIMKLKSVIWN